MSESHPKKLGEQHSLWLFQDFIEGYDHSGVLEQIRRQGRLERWGHAATIPVFADGDDIVVVIDGNVVVRRGNGDDATRLTRGDVFGKTAKGRVTSAASRGPSLEHDLTAVRETTISTIPREKLRDIWEAEQARKRASIGRWFRKREVEIPVWPLVGTLPTTRLARLLMHLVENYGEFDGDRGRLPTAVRPAQLAELAGIGKKQASRVWGLFEKTGLVSVDGGTVILEELSTLRQYALG